MTTPALDLTNFDRSADPGTDFYRYVNGGWLDTNPVPPEYGSWGAFNEVTVRNENLLKGLLEAAVADPANNVSRMAGDYYASGMDEPQIEAAGIEPLRGLLDRIDAVQSHDDLRDLAVELHRHGVGFVFGGYVSPDFADRDRHLLYLSQGGLGLPERDYYFRDDEGSATLRRQYRDHIAAQLGNLGIEAADAGRHADDIVAFETALADPSFTNTQLRDPDLTLNRHEIASLDDAMPGFGLASYLESIGAGVASTVNLNNPDFFTAAPAIVSATSIETLKAYARWNVVRANASALPVAFADEAFDFYGRTLGGQQQQKPRWKRVLAMASGDIGEVVAQLYVATAFPAEAKTRAEEMVDKIVAAMEASLHTRTWMSEPTRREALAKLAGFTVKIGYPDTWRDYSGLDIDRGPLVANRLRSAVFEHDRDVARLDEPVDPGEWSMPPHVVNAYYHPIRNEIVFPAGILQPPFFHADADDAVNFGGIGAVIGHEITHGFDDKGSRFDAEGKFRNWWADDDRTEFERRAAVVEAQFSAYEVLDGLNVNGALTLGENIADLGGLTLAYRALLSLSTGDETEIDGLTPQQRFFVSWATVWRRNATEAYTRLLVQTDPHSPGPLRAVGPLANLSEFAASFSLPESAPIMRGAEERVEIW